MKALVLLLFSLSSHAALFGVDNRQNILPGTPAAEFARSTAVAVLSANFSTDKAGNIDLDASPLTNFCSDELFANQPSLSYSCSGFLVAPDLLVTAGHCVYAINTPTQTLEHETKLACQAFSWLFDYQMNANSHTQLTHIPSDRLFRCKEIIYARQTETAPYLDYALIRLDRPAFGRKPFAISAKPVAIGDAVAMIGYPLGTPAKLTDSARVTLNTPSRDSFLTSLDAFEGNSGSAVFNMAHEIVGILVGGTPSWNTYTPKGLKCERVNRCTEDGQACSVPDKDTSIFPGYQGVGSEVQRIQPILDLLRNERH